MRIRIRLAALVFAFIGAIGLTAAAASAAPPVKFEGCELHVTVPTTGKTVIVPICNNGPPIQ